MTEAEARELVRGMTDAAGFDRLDRLCTLVLDENSRQNLISRATEQSIWTRHMLDSVQLAGLAGDRSGLWIDIGTGGGFPGLAIAAIEPERSMLLVEPRRLRTQFLERSIDTLGLAHVRAFQGKIEALQETRAAVISARAVAPVEKLLRAARHCATPATRWLLMRGRQREEGEMFHVERSRSDADGRIVVIDGCAA